MCSLYVLIVGLWLKPQPAPPPKQKSHRVQALYREYGYILRRRCRRILRDDGLVEDAMQEIFLTMFRSIDQYQGDPDKILSWLYRITTTHSLQLLDRYKRWSRDLQEPASWVPPTPPTDLPMEEQLAVGAFLNDLPQRQREAVLLRHVSGMTQEEIASVMDVTRDQVRRWLKHFQTRGRIVLRDRYAQG